MVAMEMEKDTVSVIKAMVAQRTKYFFKNINLIYIPTTTNKIKLTGQVLSEKKYCNIKRAHFEKKHPKVKHFCIP